MWRVTQIIVLYSLSSCYFLLGPNIFLSTIPLDTASLHSYLNVYVQVPVIVSLEIKKQ
jgi:hypothetical protein